MPVHYHVLIVPIIVFVVFMAGSVVLSIKGQEQKRFKRFSAPKINDIMYSFLVLDIMALVQMFFFWLAENFISHFYADINGIIPTPVLAVISFTGFLAMFLRLYIRRESLRKFGKGCALSAAVLLILEIVLFNGKSFTTDYESYTLMSDEILIETTDTASADENGVITVNGNSKLILGYLPDYTSAVSFNALQDDEALPVRIHIRMKDDNFADYYQTVADKWVSAHGSPIDFSVVPYGRVHTLEVEITDITRPLTIFSVTAMSCIPFSFSMLRYMVLFGVAAAVSAIKAFKLAKVTYNPKSAKQRIAVIVTVLMCFASSALFFIPEQELIEYPIQGGAEYTDPYIQTFDAFQNDRVWIDIEPDENLETMVNVYDADVRGKSGYRFSWDRAYFEGKYYSYFGVTPVITLYYPMYMITGKLPTVPIATGVFAALAILATCLAILAVVRLLIPKANFLLLLLSMLAATCMSGAYFCMQNPLFYNVVVASGIFSLMSAIGLGCRAAYTENKAVRFLLLAACGVAVGLCAASRPSMTIGVLVLAPVFISILIDSKQKLIFRIGQAVSFLIPVCAIGAGIMYYNFLRFGSPLDFGANYQLTVSDIHANTLRLSALFPALYHYFLQPLGVFSTFPFFAIQGFHMNNYGMYAYTDYIVGALQFPLILMGFLLIPKAFKMNSCGTGLVKFRQRGFYIACFVLAIGIAWADFCLAGTHLRYLMDIMPILVTGSICTVLFTTKNPGKLQYKIAVAALVISTVLVWLMMLTERDVAIKNQHPNLYDTLENLIVFWN